MKIFVAYCCVYSEYYQCESGVWLIFHHFLNITFRENLKGNEATMKRNLVKGVYRGFVAYDNVRNLCAIMRCIYIYIYILNTLCLLDNR